MASLGFFTFTVERCAQILRLIITCLNTPVENQRREKFVLISTKKNLIEQNIIFLVYYFSIEFWAGPEDQFPAPPRNLDTLEHLSARFDRLSL